MLCSEGGKGSSLEAIKKTNHRDDSSGMRVVRGAPGGSLRDAHGNGAAGGESRNAYGDGSDGSARRSTRAAVELDIAGVFSRHAKTVYRLCYSYFGSPHDAEDATQAVFMKLVDKPRAFEDAEHEKAWLLVVAANHCKDVLKSAQRTRAADMPDDVEDRNATGGKSDVLQAVLGLPAHLKDCVYLHYYEGYKTDEIARMTDTPPSTVRNRLRDARALLKAELGCA